MKFKAAPPKQYVEQTPITHLETPTVTNTWYESCHIYNARLYFIASRVSSFNETMEIRVTIDGQVIVSSAAFTADTRYYVSRTVPSACDAVGMKIDNAGKTAEAFLFEGKDIKIEVRKITTTGSTPFLVVVGYGELKP